MNHKRNKPRKQPRIQMGHPQWLGNRKGRKPEREEARREATAKEINAAMTDAFEGDRVANFSEAHAYVDAVYCGKIGVKRKQ